MKKPLCSFELSAETLKKRAANSLHSDVADALADWVDEVTDALHDLVDEPTPHFGGYYKRGNATTEDYIRHNAACGIAAAVALGLDVTKDGPDSIRNAIKRLEHPKEDQRLLANIRQLLLAGGLALRNNEKSSTSEVCILYDFDPNAAQEMFDLLFNLVDRKEPTADKQPVLVYETGDTKRDGTEWLCYCSADDVCPLNRNGPEEHRCTERELLQAGYITRRIDEDGA